MKKIIMLALLTLSTQIYAANIKQNISEDLIVKQSANSVNITMDRLEKIVKSKGVTVFLRLDHAKGANKIGNSLRPTQLLVFGNPKLGSPLMMSNQTIGIDLPLKAIVWEDSDGKVWLAYNDPTYLSKRHHIEDRKAIFTKMTKVLNKFTNYAITK